jgi:signal peptidase I
MAALALAIAIARHNWTVVTVRGASMRPALEPGDRLLVRRRRLRRLRPGNVVVFQEPRPWGTWDGLRPASAGVGGKDWVVKRLAALPGDRAPDEMTGAPGVRGRAGAVPPGHIVVLGDAADSTDSRQWGFIPATQVLGVVIRHLPPAPSAQAAVR